MPQFYTRTGRLTPYALACGYAERITPDEVQVTLWQEHGAYHVRAHDFAAGRRIEWLSFTTLAAAREAFDLARRSPLAAAAEAARRE
jgi:hypothetical protein